MHDPEHVRLALDFLRVELRPSSPQTIIDVVADGQGWPAFRFATMRAPMQHEANGQIAEALGIVIDAMVENQFEVREDDHPATGQDEFSYDRACECGSGPERLGDWHNEEGYAKGWTCKVCNCFVSRQSVSAALGD